MQMFLDNGMHSQFLLECVEEGPQNVLFSSYGLYAGITYDDRNTNDFGDQYVTDTMKILNALQDIAKNGSKVRFLVGVSSYMSCKGKMPCADCEKKYVRSLIRLMNHVDRFPEINWKITTDLHMKAYLFFYKNKAKGVSGGRNFTDSNWSDVTFELSNNQIKNLYRHVQEAWDVAKPATDDTIATIANDQGILEKSFASVAIGYD
jgi:hypothetical protein